MIFDAIVLAGGRSSRLGGRPKAAMTIAGLSLLSTTLAAAAGARQRVIVGDARTVPRDLAAGVLVTRESPAFAGPASAIAAGVRALDANEILPAEFTLVLACDMPEVATAVRELLRVHDPAGFPVTDGAVAVDAGGHRQYLVGLYRTDALRTAILRNADRLENLAVRALLGALELNEIAVSEGSTDDIDTWEDAARFGIRRPPESDLTDPPDADTPNADKPQEDRKRGTAMASTEPAEAKAIAEAEKMAILVEWSRRLSAELGLDGLVVDIEGVLDLAGVAAHAVLRPAAPLTTYLVGYAAGLAAGLAAVPAENGVPAPEAFGRVSDVARALALAQDNGRK